MRDSKEKEELLKLGLRIKQLRIERNLNQTEFANKIGKDQPSINRLENGKINAGYLYLKQIAEGLEIELKDLFD